jgi:hypothetical protein
MPDQPLHFDSLVRSSSWELPEDDCSVGASSRQHPFRSNVVVGYRSAAERTSATTAACCHIRTSPLACHLAICLRAIATITATANTALSVYGSGCKVHDSGSRRESHTQDHGSVA